MAIDPRNEKLKTFGQAARMLPRRRNGKRVNPITLWRWHRYGVMHDGNRVHLEAIKTPSGLATSKNAVQRFLNALNNAGCRESNVRPHDMNAAVRQLDADGV